MENPAAAVDLRGGRPSCRGPWPLDLFDCCDPWDLFSCRPRAADAMTSRARRVEGRSNGRAWIRDALRRSGKAELNMVTILNLSIVGEIGLLLSPLVRNGMKGDEEVPSRRGQPCCALFKNPLPPGNNQCMCGVPEEPTTDAWLSAPCRLSYTKYLRSQVPAGTNMRLYTKLPQFHRYRSDPQVRIVTNINERDDAKLQSKETNDNGLRKTSRLTRLCH